MSALIGSAFLLLIGAILLFAIARLIRFVFGRHPPKQKVDDASDMVDAAKVGLGMLAVATFILAPVGFMAFLAGIKLVSVATVVSIAPGLALIFGGLAVLGSVAKIYSRRKLQQQMKSE